MVIQGHVIQVHQQQVQRCVHHRQGHVMMEQHHEHMDIVVVHSIIDHVVDVRVEQWHMDENV